MKKIIFTGILSLSVILGACSTDYDEMVQEVEEANEQAGIGEISEETQANEVEEKEKSSNPRSNATDEEKAEMKRKYEEEKAAEEKAAEEKAAAEQAAKEEAEAEKAAKEKEAAETDKAEYSVDELEQVHLSLMQEHMGMYVDVTFDKETKIYKMTPTNEQLISEIEMLPLGIGWDNWQDLVDGVASMSKTNSDSLGEGYSVTLVNPLNEENIILWVMDGEVIYNVVDEL